MGIVLLSGLTHVGGYEGRSLSSVLWWLKGLFRFNSVFQLYPCYIHVRVSA